METVARLQADLRKGKCDAVDLTEGILEAVAGHQDQAIFTELTAERARQLHLEPMSPRNQTRHQTAFTISIEARARVCIIST